MENVFKYYDFSNFKKDNSNTFPGNEISFTEINPTHFLIFEKQEQRYNLYVTKYKDKTEIGEQPPEIVELLVANYDKSIPEHRIAIKQYKN